VSCNINITSIVGGPSYYLNPTVCSTVITVSGTITSSLGSAACPAVAVSATCQFGTTTNQTYSGTVDRNGTVTGQVTSGFLVGDNWQVTLATYCCCGTEVVVQASCPALSCSEFKTVQLQCQPPCCPVIYTQVSCGECDGSGNALVTFTVSVNAATANNCPVTEVQMDFGDGSQLGGVHTFPPSGSFTEQHTYGPGTHLAFVNVNSPTGCQQVEVPFNVPCPIAGCCPDITAKVEYGPCDPAGNSLVTFHVTVTPVTTPGCPPTTVQMDFGDGSSLGALHTFTSAGTFTEQHPYSAGPHTPFIKITSPLGCKQVQIPINVQCPSCCPDISITPCIPDCDSDANRTVEFLISVTPKPLPCPPTAISFQMDFGDGSPLGNTVTLPAGSPPYSYTEIHTYQGNAALNANTASLHVTQPPQCAGTYAPQNIPACCTKARAAWCGNLLWLMSFLLAFALLFLLFSMGGSLASTALNTFYVLAIAGIICLIIYLIFCTKCKCGWLYLLLWRILFGAGIMYAIFAACGLAAWSILIGLVLMLIGFWLLNLWKKACCVSECRYLLEIFRWWTLLSPFVVWLYSHALSGCAYSFVIFGYTVFIYAIVAFAWAVFSLYFANKCLKGDSNPTG
jgi:hypothetical protein